ncbi:hypothetical protein MRX96_014766 [Rhipicephalus microplus]
MQLCEVVVTPGPWTAEQRITVEETKRCTVGHLWRTTGTAIVAASFVGGKNSTVFTSYRCKRRIPPVRMSSNPSCKDVPGLPFLSRQFFIFHTSVPLRSDGPLLQDLQQIA